MRWLILLSMFALAGAPPPGGWPPAPQTARVVSVYDGDTFTLDTAGADRVRLRWVNTPELRPAEKLGVEAKEAAERFVLNQEVRLLTGQEPRDGYGRILAGLETKEGNLSVHLLKLGLGHLFVIPPDDTDFTEMLAAQKAAQAAGRGLWGLERYKDRKLHITSFHANAPGDDRENVNGEYLRVVNIHTEPVNVGGYRITKATGQSWEFPSMVIPVGHSVKVKSGQGGHQMDESKQLEIYLGEDFPIWNNKADTATIYDRFGVVQDMRLHAVKG